MVCRKTVLQLNIFTACNFCFTALEVNVQEQGLIEERWEETWFMPPLMFTGFLDICGVSWHGQALSQSLTSSFLDAPCLSAPKLRNTAAILLESPLKFFTLIGLYLRWSYLQISSYAGEQQHMSFRGAFNPQWSRDPFSTRMTLCSKIKIRGQMNLWVSMLFSFLWRLKNIQGGHFVG